jgi:steroid delta-isomerase-like uncharacterized protein
MEQSDPVRRVVAAWYDAWNAHDATAIAALIDPEFTGVDVADPQPQSGMASVAATFARYLTAFPDFSVRPKETVVDGDRAALYWEASGTHRGEFLLIPPTGKFVTVDGSSLLTIRDGRILQARHIWDLAGVLRTLRLLPIL